MTTELNLRFPPRSGSFADFRKEFQPFGAGDALWKKVIESAKQQMREPGCFVAGTLVHTKDGLRPIEQINVGDWVLSKLKSGEGEQSYQPVTRTFSHDNRELYWVGMNELDKTTGKVLKHETEYFAVTGEHPIWVEYCQRLKFQTYEPVITLAGTWVTVEDFWLRCWNAKRDWEKTNLTIPEAHATLANGSLVQIYTPERILQGHSQDEGALFSGNNAPWMENCMATRIRFSKNGAEIVQDPEIVLGEAEDANYDYTGYDVDSPMSLVKLSGGHLPMRRTVYNFEVANTHTYFVGELGLWVHNKNPGDAPLASPLLRVSQNPRAIPAAADIQAYPARG